MNDAQQVIEQGLQHHLAGRFAEAEATYRAVLSAHPDHPRAMQLLGIVYCQHKRYDDGLHLIRRAIDIEPLQADYHVNLAYFLNELGQHAEAASVCRQALKLDPNRADACNNLGMALRELGQLEEAHEAFSTAIRLEPRLTAAAANLAGTLHRLGRYSDAVGVLHQLLGVEKPRPELHLALGENLHAMRRLQEAEQAYRQALAMDPSNAQALGLLALAIHEHGRPAEAIPFYEQAIAAGETNERIYSNIGLALSTVGELERGIEFYHKALQLRPDFPNAHNNLANALRDQMKLPEARVGYDRTLFFQPDHSDAHWNRSLLLLLTGDFEAGWREYEWRWLKFPRERRNFTQPRWDGYDIAGKSILLFAEQGVGDTIQFARLISAVAARGAKVVLECVAELDGLLRNAPGVSRIVHRGQPTGHVDVQCPLMSLGYILNIRTDSIPADVPYLKADEQRIAHWRQRLRGDDGLLNVGIAWAGAPTHQRDQERSVKRNLFAPLAEVEGVRLVNLQKHRPAWDDSGQTPPLIDYTSELNDFAETAALIENLDLIISVDTGVVHLAGALAKPVWTLLPFVPDWRWMLEREDTPWYPTMRLFRQQQRGDWSGVIARIKQELLAFVERHRTR